MSERNDANGARAEPLNLITETTCPVDLTVEQMRWQISALIEEVAALREAAREKNALEELVLQLRDANQKLVVATLNAQSLQDEAEAMNRKQQEYLSMLAHELRNPLGRSPLLRRCWQRFRARRLNCSSFSKSSVVRRPTWLG